MATDTLEIFGTEYTGVTGVKATDSNNQTKTYIRPQGTKSISANGTGIDVTEYASVDVSVPSSSPTIQSLTVNPSTTQQTFNASGVDGYKPVTVSAMPTGTAGTPTATKGTVSNHSVSVTPSVTNSAGYIAGGTNTGTAVTVTASELASGNKAITQNGTDIDVVGYSTVSVNVSQQFTATIENNGATSGNNYAYVKYNNTNYYTAGDTFTFSEGDTLTCLADALSGASKIYVNDEEVRSGYTISYAYSLPASDITIRFSAISSGSSVKIYTNGYTSKNVQVLQSTSRTNSSSLTKVLGDLTVSKTGTYDIYWSGGRTNTSTSYTWGTRLYVDGSGYDTENTTWTNNCQSNHLSNVSLTVNQKLSVYARGRTGSYYTFAPMLVIIEA